MLLLCLFGIEALNSQQGPTEVIDLRQDFTEAPEPSERFQQGPTEVIDRLEEHTEAPEPERKNDLTTRTLIGTYDKIGMRDDSIEETLKRLNNMEGVKVEHLPNVGGFILTFKSESHRLDRTEELMNMDIDWSEDHMVELPITEKGKMLSLSDLSAMTRTGSIPPDDSYFSSLWAFQDLSNNADINMQEGWQEYAAYGGSSNSGYDVVVAVVDTGIDYTVDDLKDKIWTNPEEIANNGIDDDNNGIVDDIRGADFTGDNAPGNPFDNHYHGTHVGGTIAAKGNNGAGIVGVAAYTDGVVRNYKKV